jgi:hypothetical protein
MSDCPVRGFCEVYLNFGGARVGPDNVRLEVSILWMIWSCSTTLFLFHLSRPS